MYSGRANDGAITSRSTKEVGFREKSANRPSLNNKIEKQDFFRRRKEEKQKIEVFSKYSLRCQKNNFIFFEKFCENSEEIF